MLQYEYRGYKGHVPKKPDPLNELILILVYQVSLHHFEEILSLMVESFYSEYDGKNDLFGENGRINTEGKLTKHLWDRYNCVIRIVNSTYKSVDTSHLDIEKYVLLPDLSFAAVLRDGTVMVQVDKE